MDSTQLNLLLDPPLPPSLRRPSEPAPRQPSQPGIASGEKAKARDIIAAIRALKAIEQERRPATAEEKQALSRFSGFGPVALSIFPDPVTGTYRSRAALRPFRLATTSRSGRARSRAVMPLRPGGVSPRAMHWRRTSATRSMILGF
jgi:hypothetical protein